MQEYVDHETGGISKRLHFQRLFADARRHRFDLLLFWALDRFSREGVTETLNHLQRLTTAGVNWRSFTEEYLDSCGILRDAVLSIATIAKARSIVAHLAEHRKAVCRRSSESRQRERRGFESCRDCQHPPRVVQRDASWNTP